MNKVWACMHYLSLLFNCNAAFTEELISSCIDWSHHKEVPSAFSPSTWSLMFSSPPALNSLTKSFLFIFSRKIWVYLLPSLSVSVNHSIVILYFTSNICWWVSTYLVCLSRSGLPHAGCFLLGNPFAFKFSSSGSLVQWFSQESIRKNPA